MWGCIEGGGGGGWWSESWGRGGEKVVEWLNERREESGVCYGKVGEGGESRLLSQCGGREENVVCYVNLGEGGEGSVLRHFWGWGGPGGCNGIRA